MDSDSKKEYIYKASLSLRPAAIAWSKRFASVDIFLVEDILMDTVTHLIEINIDLTDIRNFPSYFFTVYKRRFYDYLKSVNKNIFITLTNLNIEEETYLAYNAEIQEKLEVSILLEEFVGNTNDKSRFIFTMMLLGYSYKEIVPFYNRNFSVNVKENTLRSVISKSFSRFRNTRKTKTE